MNKLYLYITFLLTIPLFFSCIDDPDMPDGIQNAHAPSVEIIGIDHITAFSFNINAQVVRENGDKVVEKGFYWSTDSVEVKNGKAKSIVIDIASDFTSSIDYLADSTRYYVSAYAKNSLGEIGLSKIDSVITRTGSGKITTIDPEEISVTSAISGGIIDPTLEGEVIRYGIYYSVEDMSTSSINKDSVQVNNALEPDIYTFKLKFEDLEENTKYYIRAYIETQYGIIIGNQKEFTTKKGKPTIASFVEESVGYTGALFSALIIDEGASPVIERGFYYSEWEDFAIADTITVGGGIGQFRGFLENLLPEKSYFIKAYAENEAFGVEETEVLQFTTLKALPTVSTLSIALTTSEDAVIVKGEIQDVGISRISEVGICWGASDVAEPTIEKNDTIHAAFNGVSFSHTIKLKGSTTYNIRVYARNDAGISYGQTKEFTTPLIFTNSAVFDGGTRMRGAAAFFAIKGQGYLLGGNDLHSMIDEFWTFIPNKESSNETWIQKYPSYPLKRSWMATACTSESVMVFGGINENNKPTNDFYYHNIYTVSWYKININGDLPEARSSSAGCYVKDNAFFIGGEKENRVKTNEVLNYIEPERRWIQKTPLPEAQFNSIAVVINDVIYTGLGETERGTSPTGSRKLWSSSDLGDTWVSETDLPSTGGLIRAGVALDQSIYVIDDNGYIWQYNTEEKKWTKKSRLQENNREIFCMYALNNRIYIGFSSGTRQLISYDPRWDK
ncbi:hypothetical protein [Parabacteroides sp. PF5-9]|uniref:Kelch repeat-containing protein n=1 Tax=Parabacteroides sp. PF5-9 TaxID=1742404 RepID=UPI002474E2DA|nr:hypothetical protein [Parabacteroides sp. PF5-9]MDH6356460.1 hypothetical protein [Parabacteroides sp. PF5-9]